MRRGWFAEHGSRCSQVGTKRTWGEGRENMWSGLSLSATLALRHQRLNLLVRRIRANVLVITKETRPFPECRPKGASERGQYWWLMVVSERALHKFSSCN